MFVLKSINELAEVTGVARAIQYLMPDILENSSLIVSYKLPFLDVAKYAQVSCPVQFVLFFGIFYFFPCVGFFNMRYMKAYILRS
jgi:hypothetical protein